MSHKLAPFKLFDAAARERAGSLIFLSIDEMERTRREEEDEREKESEEPRGERERTLLPLMKPERQDWQ